MIVDGQKLKEILATDGAYKILDRGVGGSWIAGGCLLLARALERLLPGSLVYILHKTTPNGLPSPKHCVVKYRGRFIDGNGAQSEEDLLQYWLAEEGVIGPYLRPYDVGDLCGIVSDVDSEVLLASLLSECVSAESLGRACDEFGKLR